MSTTRVKDATFVQQHIEKMVLGVGVLIFLLTVLLYVVGKPFSYEVGNNEYENASDAIAVLQGTRRQIEVGLNDPNPVPLRVPPAFAADFRDMLVQPVNPQDSVQRLADGGLTSNAVDPPPVDPPRYVSVTPPMPEKIEYVFGEDVLDAEFNPDVVNAYKELMGLDRRPLDFSMFIAAADFNAYEWAKRLRETKGGEDEIAIPQGISSQRFGIAGVALLRQTWDEKKGGWGDERIVPALPGQVRLLPSDKAPSEPNEAVQTVLNLRESQPEIARPELPWLTGFVQAVAPGDDDLRFGDELEAINGALGEGDLGPTEKKIKQLEARIAQIEARRAERQERQGDRPPSEGNDGREDPESRQIAKIQRDIERLRPRAEEEKADRERLAELAKKRAEERQKREEERKKRAAASRQPDDFAIEQEKLEVAEGATIRVWAADPTMRPGKTYRYKLLVSVINPLYAVPRLAKDQLAENQSRAAILPSQAEIDKAPWITQVTVEPESRFFFTSGSEDSAKVEVFRRVNGELRKGTFEAAPGDTIGDVVTKRAKSDFEQDEKIDLRVGSLLVDIEERRNLEGKSVYVMIYMDEDGNLYERSQIEDYNSPARKTKEREMKEGSDMPLRADGGDSDGFNDGF